MTNTELLKTKIKKRGLKKGFIAKSLNLSYKWLRKRLEGEKDFTVNEMQILCRLLDLNDAEKKAIFFADDVEETSTSGN